MAERTSWTRKLPALTSRPGSCGSSTARLSGRPATLSAAVLRAMPPCACVTFLNQWVSHVKDFSIGKYKKADRLDRGSARPSCSVTASTPRPSKRSKDSGTHAQAATKALSKIF